MTNQQPPRDGATEALRRFVEERDGTVSKDSGSDTERRGYSEV
ncbi:hypothetical protein [Halogeometricum borinquense]